MKVPQGEAARVGNIGQNDVMARFEYSEFAPRAELTPFVRAIWRLDAVDDTGVEGRVEPVLPDGCVEWVLHFGDPFWARDSRGGLAAQENHLIAGPSSKPAYLARGGESHVLGVRFEPGAARCFGLPSLDTLTDRIVETRALGLPALERIRATIERESGPSRIRRVEAALLDLVAAHRGQTSVDLMNGLREVSSIRNLAKSRGMSTRTLERRFASDVGFAPATVRAIERFRRSLESIANRPHSRLVEIALESGYSDEAHFCREFRRFADCTPGEYRRASMELTEAFAVAPAAVR